MLNKVEEKTGDQVAVAKFRSLMEKKRRTADFKKYVENEEKTGRILDWGVQDLAMAGSFPPEKCDAERAFSRFNLVLTDRRTNLTESNLSKMMFCLCNYF